MKKLRRREWLTMGAAAATTPFLGRLVRRAQADEAGGGIQKRFITFPMPNGWDEESFVLDDGTGALGACLTPLEEFRDHFMILRNLDFANTNTDGANDFHNVGQVIQLSGELPMKNADDRWAATGQSIDRAIGAGIRGDALYTSYGFAPLPGGAISSDGFGAAQRAHYDLQDAWDGLFSSITPSMPDPAIERDRAMRGSIVDFARGEYGAAVGRLSGASRRRIELHQQRMSELQTRIAGFSPGLSCEPPERFGDPRYYNRYSHLPGETVPVVIDMIIAAFACGITNVASFQIGSSSNIPGRYIPEITIQQDHHALSHWYSPDRSDAENAIWRRDSVRSQRFFVEQLATIMRRLSEIEEVDGSSMLDHTVILIPSETAYSPRHSHQGIPFLLAGNADGYFRTGGREIDCGGAPHSNLFTSLMDAYGLGAAPYGSFSTGLLPGLT